MAAFREGESTGEVPDKTTLDGIAQAHGQESINWGTVPKTVRVLIGRLATDNIELTEEAAELVTGLTAANARAEAAERRAALAEQAAKKAFVDEKTGLPNLTAFVRDMRALTRSLTTRSIVRFGEVEGTHETLLFFDLDKFKPINEDCGYDLGDYVLKAVTRGWRETQRPGDETYRWGGDEFTKIARGVAPGADEAVAQNIVDSVQQTRTEILARIEDEEAFEVLWALCNDETQALPKEQARQRMRNVVGGLGVSVGYTPITRAMAGITQDEIVRSTYSKMQQLKHAKARGDAT